MKRLLIICLLLPLLLSGQTGLRSPAFVAQLQRPSAGGGGSPQWYDSIASGSTSADQSQLGGNFEMGASITVGQSGNATKLRVYIQDCPGDPGIKLALYDNSNVLKATVTSTISDASAPYSKEVNIGSPPAVTAGTYKVVVLTAGGAEILYRRGAVAAQTEFYGSADYATFPRDPFTSDGTLTGPISVGVYVEP